MYYIGDIDTHDRIRFLPFLGKFVAENVERVGILLFSDQMTALCDPAPCLQEVLLNYLTQAADEGEDQTEAQDGRPSGKMPGPSRSSGPRSARGKTASGAPRRK